MSKEEAIKILKGAIKKPNTKDGYLGQALTMGIEALENQKTGHWITWKEAGNEILSETRFECSVCHDAAQTLCNGLDLLSPYCPNCGAKMEGENNE